MNKSDLAQIKIVVQEAIEPLKRDVSGIKQDVSVLKTDVSGLKQDVSVLKTNVSKLQKDMSSVKKDINKLQRDQKAAIKVFDTVSNLHHRRLDRVEGHLRLPHFST